MDIRQAFRENPLLAILRNVPGDRVLDYVQAVLNGGIRMFEVALNTPDAPEQLSAIRKRFGDRIILGAGTATDEKKARTAMEAGAQFLLSPSADEEVLSYCRENNIPFLPGALTPTEVSLCLRYGFDTIKLFPAGDMPGNYLRSLKGPFPETEYVAIGGVNRLNIPEFMNNGYLAVGLGSNLLPKKAAGEGQWDECSRYAEELLKEARKAQSEKYCGQSLRSTEV